MWGLRDKAKSVFAGRGCRILDTEQDAFSSVASVGLILCLVDRAHNPCCLDLVNKTTDTVYTHGQNKLTIHSVAGTPSRDRGRNVSVGRE